jgi:hypothetical protein
MRSAVAILPLLLAACSRPEPVQSPPAEAPPPAGSGAPRPGDSLPPAEAANRYVGLWATDARGCTAPPWRFEADRLTTKGEVACRFDQVRKAPDGYDIDATCTAEGPPKAYRLKLGFAESAKAMLVDGGPFSPTGLVWCGPA